MKPGPIKKFFIYLRIDNIVKKELKITKELAFFIDMDTDRVIQKCNELVDQLTVLNAKKKKLYFKLL